jgi:DHA2 family multidrug resistance protein-like MFS transporter
MSAVPEAKAGVGSAMNDLFRQLGGALGVAVIGSAINTVYRERIADAITGLPAPAADAAGDSVGAAVAIAGQVGGTGGQALAAAARAGFTDALGVAAIVAASVAVLTAIFVFRAMPARPAEPAAAATLQATAGPGALTTAEDQVGG